MNKRTLSSDSSKRYGIISLILGFVGLGFFLGLYGLIFLNLKRHVDRLNCIYGIVIGIIMIAFIILFFTLLLPYLLNILEMVGTF